MKSKEAVTGGKLCKMANISRKTLRWWVENGLIECEKDQTNGYHLFNINSLHDVCDIKFLQKAGFSLKQIKNREHIDMSLLKELYQSKCCELTKQIENLIHAQKITNKQIDIIDYINEKHNSEIIVEDPPFDFIEELDMHNQNIVRTRILKNCYDVSYLTNNINISGISSNTALTDNPVWKKNKDAKFFKVLTRRLDRILMKRSDVMNKAYPFEIYTLTDNFISEKIKREAPNKKAAEGILKTGNLKEVLNNLIMLGYNVKSIIAVWLLNGSFGDEIYRFFDTYLEY